jgi:hypothetical protein
MSGSLPKVHCLDFVKLTFQRHLSLPHFNPNPGSYPPWTRIPVIETFPILIAFEFGQIYQHWWNQIYPSILDHINISKGLLHTAGFIPGIDLERAPGLSLRYLLDYLDEQLEIDVSGFARSYMGALP